MTLQPIHGTYPTCTTSCFLPSCSPRLLLLVVLYLGIRRLFRYGQDCGSSHDSISSSYICCPLYSFPLSVYTLLVYLLFIGPVNTLFSRRAPALSVVIELGYETGLNLFWRSLPLHSCLTLMNMRVLAVHSQSLLVILFPLHYFLKPHTQGPPLLPSCGSDSACKHEKNGP